MRALLACLLILGLAACADDDDGLPGARGQWVLVNYWAQWCAPCIEEVPELNALDTARDDVRVFGVNYDGATGEELAEQVTRLGIDFPTLATDPAASLGIPRPMVLPTTLLLDPQGQYVTQLVGPQTLESLSEAVDSAIGDG
jgi:thiol-disulfide isomerase/thioredoxin